MAAALEIIDTGGVQALSMRRLARRLGCAPMSLYRHVASKDELLGFVVEALAEQMPAGDAGADWRETVTSTFSRIRRVLHDHPGIAAHVVDAAMITPTTLAMVETVLTALRDAGLDDGEAARSFVVLWTHTLGSVLVEQSAATDGSGGAGAGAASREGAEERRREVVQAVDGVASATYPAVEAAAAHWTDHDPDAGFTDGLELILDGIVARLRI